MLRLFLATCYRAIYRLHHAICLRPGKPLGHSRLVVVGSYRTGGAGKTPFCTWLAETLSAHEKHVAILCHVGVNVGMNISSPKILMERCDLPLEKAALASTAYFLSRTVSSFCTPFILRLVPGRKYLTVCLSLMTLGLLAMAFGRNAVLLYSGICLVGFGGVNIYPLIFSNAILKVEDKKRNVFSSLMAMAFIGGAVFPTLMGVAGDRFGQIGSVAMMAVGLAYLWFYSRSEARN